MFEKLITEDATQKVAQQDDCVAFLDLYVHFRQDITDLAADRVRIAKFEIKVDNAWRALPQDKRDIIAAGLLAKKLLPEETALAIKHLKAKVVGIV
jgi:hypothetical protein